MSNISQVHSYLMRCQGHFGGSNFLVRLFLGQKYPVPTNLIRLVLSHYSPVQYPCSFCCFVHIDIVLQTIMTPILLTQLPIDLKLAIIETLLCKFCHHRIPCTCIYCKYHDQHTKCVFSYFMFMSCTSITRYCSLLLMVDHSQNNQFQ